MQLVEGYKISTKVNDEDLGIYYYEKNSNPKIFHLIFANENSNAGNYYNNYTLEFFEHSYQQQVTDIKPFDIIESVKERFIEISRDIIDYSETKSIFSMDDFLTNQKIIKGKRLRLKNNEENIKLKKCYIDETGFSKMKSNGYDPPYNYYKLNNKLIIRIECPGNYDSIKHYLNYSGEYTIITIKGNKKKDKEPEKIEDNIYNSREFGNFCINIPFKSEMLKIKNQKPESKPNKVGMIILEYELEQTTENNSIIEYTSEEI